MNERFRRYRVSHRTTYRYSAEMRDGYSVAMLLARETPTQEVTSSVLSTQPDVDERDDRRDVFGNRVVQLGVHRPHTELVVDVDTEVAVYRHLEPRLDPSWEQAVAQTAALRGTTALEISPFFASSRLIPIRADSGKADGLLRRRVIDGFAAEFTPGRSLRDVIRGVCSSIFNQYRFDATATTVSTPLERVIEQRSGVCQDFAHLAVAVFRARGLAARYVSGYIETDAPPGEPKMVGADASHAWCAVWIPDHGWIDLDPTNDIVGADRHVTVGWGRDYADVAPIRGVVIGPVSQQELSVAVDMTRLS